MKKYSPKQILFYVGAGILLIPMVFWGVGWIITPEGVYSTLNPYMTALAVLGFIISATTVSSIRKK